MDAGIDSWRMVRALSREELMKSYDCQSLKRGRVTYFHDFWSRMGFEYIVHGCGLVGESGHVELFSFEQVDR
jgi:hypothetical protein